MNSPLRIVIGADTFSPDINGAARFAQQLATGLAGRGHEVHVICPSDTGEEYHTSGDITVHRLAAHRTPFHPTFRICLPWRTGRAVKELLADIQPHIVHTQAHFAVGRAVVKAADTAGIPVLATNHFMPENLFGYVKVPGFVARPVAGLAWRDLARVLRPATLVTAPTPTAVAMLREHEVGERTLAVSCGVDLDRLRTQSGPSGSTVLFVGRLDQEKRVEDLLHALALLPDRLGVRVELVGDGSCRGELERLAERLGVADRVRFLGFVSDEELVAAYARCAVFCMPGVAELQSLATMEAMAAGRPVVAADAVALPHLVKPGRNGWLFPPGDSVALAAALTRLFDEPGLLARMGSASAELISWHDVHASLAQFEELYLDALGIKIPQMRQVA